MSKCNNFSFSKLFLDLMTDDSVVGLHGPARCELAKKKEKKAVEKIKKKKRKEGGKEIGSCRSVA